MTTSTNRDRIAQAINDEEWQEFRKSLKGQSTHQKVALLECYWIDKHKDGVVKDTHDDCAVCIRVDNYIKALCRGGQLVTGVNLNYALDHDFIIDTVIKK